MFKQYFSFVLGLFEGSEQKYLYCFQNSILGINKKRLKNRDNEILLVAIYCHLKIWQYAPNLSHKDST